MSMKRMIQESLNSSKLEDRVMKKVKGGDCRCGCHYADSGGSSSENNWQANNLGPNGGLHSPGHNYVPEV
jgi:natural product precursor